MLSLLKLNNRKKGTLIMKGSLGNLDLRLRLQGFLEFRKAVEPKSDTSSRQPACCARCQMHLRRGRSDPKISKAKV